MGDGQWLVHNGPGCDFWTSNPRKGWDPVKNAYEHWKKHGDEFPELQNAKEYWDAARNLLENPPAGTLTAVRKNGEIVMYDPKTNTFLAALGDSTPKTMFRPSSGMDYWLKQVEQIKRGR